MDVSINGSYAIAVLPSKMFPHLIWTTFVRNQQHVLAIAT
jgi:hypothetical protein